MYIPCFHASWFYHSSVHRQTGEQCTDKLCPHAGSHPGLRSDFEELTERPCTCRRGSSHTHLRTFLRPSLVMVLGCSAQLYLARGSYTAGLLKCDEDFFDKTGVRYGHRRLRSFKYDSAATHYPRSTSRLLMASSLFE